ncbi:hypothetical protein PIB30_030395 [Stylosanthes scabra]|uniref:CRIB domain-containing protein n=1 Tax=Stylosanthes scabra TaxID=79078 RepID=A0ABU6YAJ4_9FABA|nr:hypothetical protein [Stylosanthes scabra]
MPNNCKVKGILKGIRFISQVFDSEKEKEIEIGYPTDVKHVAHIGWQGHSAENNPSWMNEFKSSPGLTSSAPLSLYGNDNSAQCVSEDSDSSAVKRGSRSMNGEERDARSSRKQSMRESHAKEKSDRPRNPKTRSSKSKESSSSCNNNNNNNSKCSSEQPPPIQIQQQIQGCSSEHQPPRNNLLPDVSKRTSSIKVKDAGSTATKSRSSRPQHHHHRDHNLNRDISSRSGHHKARNKHSRHLEEDQSEESEHDQDQNGHHQVQRGSGKILLTN